VSVACSALRWTATTGSQASATPTSCVKLVCEEATSCPYAREIAFESVTRRGERLKRLQIVSGPSLSNRRGGVGPVQMMGAISFRGPVRWTSRRSWTWKKKQIQSSDGKELDLYISTSKVEHPCGSKQSMEPSPM